MLHINDTIYKDEFEQLIKMNEKNDGFLASVNNLADSVAELKVENGISLGDIPKEKQGIIHDAFLTKGILVLP